MSFLVKNTVYFEVLLVLGFAAALIFGETWGVYVSLGLLAAVYFLVAIKQKKTSESNFVFGILRIAGISNAIAVSGILFRLVEWPGSHILLVIGLTALIISVFLEITAILRNADNTAFLRMAVIRAMILVVAIATLLLFPQISALPSTVP